MSAKCIRAPPIGNSRVCKVHTSPAHRILTCLQSTYEPRPSDTHVSAKCIRAPPIGYSRVCKVHTSPAHRILTCLQSAYEPRPSDTHVSAKCIRAPPIGYSRVCKVHTSPALSESLVVETSYGMTQVIWDNISKTHCIYDSAFW